MKLLSLFLALSLVSQTSFADCSLKDIVHNPDGTMTYSKADHICVGQTIQDNNTKAQQIQELNKAITLKDLAITKADARAQNWMDTSLKLEDNIQKMDALKKNNEWIYFALGVLATGLAGITAAQLSRSH